MGPAGGFFVAAIGGAMIAAAAFAMVSFSRCLLFGAIVGAIGIIIIRRRARRLFGKPTPIQVWSLAAAIALEVIAFNLVSASHVLRGRPTIEAYEVTLAIVAAHFLLMYWSLGPIIVALGVSCLAWVAIGSVCAISAGWLIAVDGGLKVVFGLFLVAPLIYAIRESKPA